MKGLKMVIDKTNLKMKHTLYLTAPMKVKDREKLLERIVFVIKENLGIRPSQLNRLLNIHHSWNLRQELIQRELIRKEKKYSAVYYYPKKS